MTSQTATYRDTDSWQYTNYWEGESSPEIGHQFTTKSLDDLKSNQVQEMDMMYPG